jgi:hypothetical protein
MGPTTTRDCEGVDDFIRGPQMDPVLSREVVEREQHIDVVGDLRDGLAELRAVGSCERGDGIEGVPAIFSVPDLGQGLLCPGMGRLR